MRKAVAEYISKLNTPMLILWCYLIWYFSIISLYFDTSIKLWASSLGISLIIGFALILSTNQHGMKQNKWIKFRLFLFPFCVSSYSATIKDHDFMLLFPNNRMHLLLASLNCLLFISFIWLIKLSNRFYTKKEI